MKHNRSPADARRSDGPCVSKCLIMRRGTTAVQMHMRKPNQHLRQSCIQPIPNLVLVTTQLSTDVERRSDHREQVMQIVEVSALVRFQRGECTLLADVATQVETGFTDSSAVVGIQPDAWACYPLCRRSRKRRRARPVSTPATTQVPAALVARQRAPCRRCRRRRSRGTMSRRLSGLRCGIPR